jgi:hypothetical protein
MLGELLMRESEVMLEVWKRWELEESAQSFLAEFLQSRLQVHCGENVKCTSINQDIATIQISRDISDSPDCLFQNISWLEWRS